MRQARLAFLGLALLAGGTTAVCGYLSIRDGDLLFPALSGAGVFLYVGALGLFLTWVNDVQGRGDDGNTP